MTAARGTLAVAMAAFVLRAALRRRMSAGAGRIVRVSRVVADLDQAEAFYQDALGFRTIGRGPADPAAVAALGLPGAGSEEVVMRLGGDEVALVRLATPGRPYPAGSRSDDLWFQHLAIIVGDMDAAHAGVLAQGGARAISQGGPQTLPPADGSVRAWKFRDPDGHPLELLWFPPGGGRAVWRGHPPGTVFLGVDHSALAVSNGARSLRFYRRLGFKIAARSHNAGPAQSRLDGLPGARLRVFSLRPTSTGGPGLELLAYRPPGRSAATVCPGDVAADWTTVAMFARGDATPHRVRDPDGHMLLLTG